LVRTGVAKMERVGYSGRQTYGKIDETLIEIYSVLPPVELLFGVFSPERQTILPPRFGYRPANLGRRLHGHSSLVHR